MDSSGCISKLPALWKVKGQEFLQKEGEKEAFLKTGRQD